MQPNVVKMNKPFIALCPEITRSNARNLMHWLDDDNVVRYLSDSRDVSRSIEQVLGRVQLPILTHLFNSGGRFFIAYDRHDVPVGFVRLVKTGADCEIVLVIGDRQTWGRKLGASALREGMKLAFFDMRADKLIARIHTENTRSLNAFTRCGFLLKSETPTLKSFSLSAESYLRHLREGAGDDGAELHITEIDKARLTSLLAIGPGPTAVDLEYEIERATVVETQRVAPEVVTMNTRALLHLDDEPLEVALVYPEDADIDAGKLSICSDIGTAILGYKEGDAIDWRIRDRTRRISIDKVLYQPEAAGDFHL